MPYKIVVFLCVFTLCLLGCSELGSNGTDGDSTTAPIRPTQGPINTLVPTFTPLPEAFQMVTATPIPHTEQIVSEPTATVDFAQPVVQFIYRIPALGLERSLEANISGQIIAVDQTAILGMQRTNQSALILDLQQRLPEIELQPMPENCDACVYFEYTLPLDQESRQGWLQDPIILASIENYMSALLGPHFPPGTVVGLRREASSYYPAHSIALMTDATIYTWFATEPRVDEPFASPLLFADILAELPLTEMVNTYAVSCAPEPIETLRIYTDVEPLDITIRCPAYALPSSLLPLYTQLDQILADKLATYDGPPRPPTGIALDALVDYKRLDGNQLTLSFDGRITVQTSDQIIYTDTMTTTGVLSITNDLLNSGQLKLGLNTFLEDGVTGQESGSATSSILLVRGPDGIVDGEFEAIDLPFLADLNALLDSFLSPTEAVVATPTADLTTTPEAATAEPVTATPTPTPSS